jgi:GTP cyclohydrolase I
MDHPITLDPRLTEDGKMPDVASNDGSQLRGRLDRVGMHDIELPVVLKLADGSSIQVPARADAFVNLENPDAKGIHMSRLYLALQDHLCNRPLTPALLKDCLTQFIASHADLSTQSHISIRFEQMLQRPALISDNVAWRSYPCEIKAELNEGKISFMLKVRVVYSSTCPCSAALARQLIQEAFRNQFGAADQIPTEQVDAWLATEEAICATPHSQRSYADIEIVLDKAGDTFPFIAMIDGAEQVLQTAVQAAVKREDEQEFARLNGQNLMFCEDAARRLRHWLDTQTLKDYRVKVSHIESLHPHDAVSIVVKGVAGGLKPE